MSTRAIGSWTTTIILGVEALVGGVVGLTNGREMIVAGAPVDDVMTHLGYPVYFARILGVWEVLAGIALLVPRFARLKEWALRRHLLQHNWCWRHPVRSAGTT